MGMFSWDVTGTLKFFNKAKGFGYATTPQGDVHLSANAFKGDVKKTEFKEGQAIGLDLGPKDPKKKTPSAKSWNFK